MPIWEQDPALLLFIWNSVSWGKWWRRGEAARFRRAGNHEAKVLPGSRM